LLVLAVGKHISLDQAVDGLDGSIGVDLQESDFLSPEELAVNQEDCENVATWLNLLPDLPRMVVMRLYGLDGRDSETLSALRLLRRMVESGRIPADAAILS
jgi:DNA-directed RNA polymerase sigma subunit (sigma70/sigma32)